MGGLNGWARKKGPERDGQKLQIGSKGLAKNDAYIGRAKNVLAKEDWLERIAPKASTRKCSIKIG